jgi:predicted transcriptional regulator
MTKNTLKHRSKKAEAKALEGENKMLALWQKENHWLRYSQIVKAMEQNGVIQRRTARLLKRLSERQILERMERARESLYRRLDKPKEYDAVSSVASLNKRVTSDMSYEFDVGGFLSHIAYGRLLGFPNIPEKEFREDEAALLHDLTTRLGFIFHALLDLRNTMLLRRLGVEAPLDQTALQEFVAQRYLTWLVRRSPDEMQILAMLKELNPQAHSEALRIIQENRKSLKELPEVDTVRHFDLADFTFEELTGKTQSEPVLEDQSLENLLVAWKSVVIETNKYENKEFEKQRKAKPPGRLGVMSVLIPRQLSERERSLRRAIAVKIARSLHARGLNEMNEMALLVTSHPWVSNVYSDWEWLVHSMMEGLEQVEKKLAVGSEEFAFEAGKSVARYHNLTIESLQALRSKNWFKKYVGVHWKKFTEGFVKGREEVREEAKDFEERFFRRSIDLDLTK